MASLPSGNIGQEICDILNIPTDKTKVFGIDIKIRVGTAAEVIVSYYLDAEDAERIKTALHKYELVQKE